MTPTTNRSNLTLGEHHLVLTVEDVDRTIEFYERLGGTAATFDGGRRAISFRDQKLNLHPASDTYGPTLSHRRPAAAISASSSTTRSTECGTVSEPTTFGSYTAPWRKWMLAGECCRCTFAIRTGTSSNSWATTQSRSDVRPVISDTVKNPRANLPV